MGHHVKTTDRYFKNDIVILKAEIYTAKYIEYWVTDK